MPTWLLEAPQWIAVLTKALPVVMDALKAIMGGSAAATTPEAALAEWTDHNTPGAPNSQALKGPDA